MRSVDTLGSVAEQGTLTLHLPIVCNYIRDHKSLSTATIVSSSTYSQRTALMVKHRFLIIHLRRQGKRDIWLRMERARSRDLALLGFVAAGGEVEANDIVTVASSKDLLFKGSNRLENTQIYSVPPQLDVFRRFLLVIVFELLTYKLTSDNCWMFCSTLQEHLGAIGKGEYTYGGPQHPNISKKIRIRIRRQCALEYPPLFYVRARYAREAFDEDQMEQEAGDIIAIVREHDSVWWEGVHVDITRRKPLGVLVRSDSVDKVPPPPLDSKLPVVLYGIIYGSYADDYKSEWDLKVKNGDLISITGAPEGSRYWQGFVNGRTEPSDRAYLVQSRLLIPITRHQQSDVKYMDVPVLVLYYAILLVPADDCSAGDTIAIIGESDNKNNDMPFGVVVDETGVCDHSGIFVDPALLLPLPLPTPMERPDLKFVANKIPVRAYARYAHPGLERWNFPLALGELVALISMGEKGFYQGVPKAQIDSEHWEGWSLDPHDLSHIETPEERPDLEFLDEFTAVLCYARIVQDDHEFSTGDLVAIIAESNWIGEELQELLALSLESRNTRHCDWVRRPCVQFITNQEAHRLRDFPVLKRI